MPHIACGFLALVLAGCTCAGTGDPHEAAARGALARARMTEVVLERVDDQTFDFTARRDEHRCRGTIIARPGPETSTAAMQYDCE